MLIPVRCMTCNKVIGSSYNKYLKMVENGKSKENAMNELGIHRICCRRIIISNVDLFETLMKYK